MDARQRLKQWLEANGKRQSELCSALLVDKARLCRFLKGSAALDLAAYRKVEAFTGGAVKADELANEVASTGLRRRRSRAAKPRPVASMTASAHEGALAAEVGTPAPAPVPLGFDAGLPKRLADASGHPELEPLFLEMLKLATSASSGPAVRQRAVADLIDRIAGKATQKIADVTVKPPAENRELLVVLEQIAIAAKPALAPPAIVSPPAPVKPDA